MKQATLKQVKFIRKLASNRNWSKIDMDLQIHVKCLLQESNDEVVMANLSLMEASDVIDALFVLPEEKTVAQAEKAERARGNRTNWKDPKVQEMMRLLAVGEIARAEVASVLGVKLAIVDIRLKWLRKHGTVEMPEYVKRRVTTHSGIEVIVPAGYVDVSQHAIDWAGFFGIEEYETFDLRVVASHFYAAERVVTAEKIGRDLEPMRQVARSYISTWAERFAKYTLAACLGEFRHRKKSGPMRLVPMDRSHKARAACQRAAEYIWAQGEETTRKAVDYMASSFKDASFFSGGGYGGPKWSKIASTLQAFVEKRIPEVVFADYVWDLSHNAGRFFDKCPLFLHETETKAVLDAKKNNQGRDILPWAKKFLRPEWTSVLETLEAINWQEGDPR